jgi:polysaccharide deacetylase family protein (PEP-CTERM system associated)
MTLVAVAGGPLRNAMTIDVEDYFQVEAFAAVISRDRWDDFAPRVEGNVDRILDRLAGAGVVATFFTLGWIAERHPAMVRRIVAAGHELASHGYGHMRADAQEPAAFRADVNRARRLLEDIGGVAIVGYRAPTFSIGRRNRWAFAVLEEAGYRYSSSVYPIRHDLYGTPDAPRVPFRPDGLDLCEIPMTTLRVGRYNLPCAGGGYFRLLPYPLFRYALRRVNTTEGRSGVFYFHPWEIDADQPRIRGCSLLARSRHYLNLGRTLPRLDRLLHDFAWGRIDSVFADALAGNAAAASLGAA